MRAKGADISKYQVTFEPQGNLDFIIQRVSYGLRADEKFKELLPGVKQIERRGAYHYFYTHIDPIEQANFFFAQQGNQGFKFLVVDYEATGNTLDEQGEINLGIFHEELYFLTSKPILLYTSPYVYRDKIIAYNEDWELVPLWMAHYNGQDIETGAPETWGDDWLFWQHTSKGNGAEYGVGSEHIDLNVFNGTVAEMDEWLGEEPEENCCEELAKQTGELYHLVAKLGGEIDQQAGEIKELTNWAEALDPALGEWRDILNERFTILHNDIARLTSDLGILRAREIEHTREHNERLDGLEEWAQDFMEEAQTIRELQLEYNDTVNEDLTSVEKATEINTIDLNGQAKEIEALYHELETANAFIHKRIDGLQESLVTLESWTHAHVDWLDNEYQALGFKVKDLEERLGLQELITDNNYTALGEQIADMQEQIDYIEVPITNHVHWYQRLWLWLTKENK